MKFTNIVLRHKLQMLMLAAVIGLVAFTEFALAPTDAQSIAPSVPAAAFTPGNVVVCRMGAGTLPLSTTSAEVFLDEYSAGGGLVNTVAMPIAPAGANNPLTGSGSAVTECQLTRSTDGNYLIVTGYAALPGVPNVAGLSSATVPRVIGRIDAAGVVDTSTTTTSFSGTNIRSAASVGGSNYWAAGANSGIVYIAHGASGAPTTISTTVTNNRSVNIFGGQLYASQAASGLRISTVGSGLPTASGQVIASIPGFPSSGDLNQYFFADLSSAVAGFDTLYVADQGGSTGGTVAGGGVKKFSLRAGAWTFNGTFPENIPQSIPDAGFLGITGIVSGTSVNLFASRGAQLARFVDLTGYDVAPTAVPTLIGTAATNTAFRGVAISPGALPPPDTTAPSITYPPLANTNSTANRVVTATISDAVGVAGGALSPRIYFRKNGAAYVSTQCALASGNAQNGTYTCTINNSLVGGVAAGDVVDYFVIAQDAAGNVASNPAGVVASNVNTVTTPPPAPNSYQVLTSDFSGAFNVGSGEAINSLTNEGGLFQMMNAGSLSGNVTVNITSNLTAETGTHALNQQTETGAGGYTVTFQAAGAARLIIGSNVDRLITLNGADRITFNGTAFGPGGLTFRNIGVGSTIVMVNDATSNSVTNCIVEGADTDVTTGVIFIGDGPVTGNDNNSITGNTVRDRSDVAGVPVNLIVNNGAGGGATNSNVTITNNQVFNFTQTGIFNAVAENTTISGNTIFQTSPRATQLLPIQLIANFGTNTVAQNIIRDHSTTESFFGFNIQDNLGDFSIFRNRIYNIDNSTGNSGVFIGIQLSGSEAGNGVSLVNNMISLVPSVAVPVVISGIYELRTAGSLDMNYNSVLIGGAAAPREARSPASRPAGAAQTYAFFRIQGSTTVVSLTGNLLFNGRGGGADNFAVADLSPASGPWSSDYNLFVGSGAVTPANFFQYGTSSVNFATWKNGPPARDANSIASVVNTGPFNVGNMFTSANDLHLKTTGNNPAINAGTNALFPGVDFDGQTRPFGPAPEIGADEVQTAATAGEVSVSGRVATTDGRGIRNIQIVVTGGDLAAPKTALTSAFGYYRIDGLTAAETYVVTVSGTRYRFETQSRVVTPGEDAVDVDFTGERR